MPTGKVWGSLGRFDLTEPPRTTVTKGDAGIQGRFKWVRRGSNATNLLESLWRRGKQGYREVLGRFYLTEPPRTIVTKGDAGLQGRFEWVRGGSNTPNLLEPLWRREKQAYRGWFERVPGGSTSPNLFEPLWQRGMQAYREGSIEFGRFEYTRFGVVEPPRTHSKLPFRPASPFITVVQVGSVWSNRPELTRTFPVVLLPHLSQWFEEVRCSWTSPNWLQTALPTSFPASDQQWN